MESRTDISSVVKAGVSKTKKVRRPKTKLDKELDKEIKEEIHDGSLEEVIVKRNIIEE
jgi:Arc/MetJ-type ribon-helix-helix transcriptional regulator